ncbi:hypothetical protein DAI22_05g040600 [Oryza sativa Japonica Group]|nr:hypothetical protein DAI22_05g040600 [Oryza sativa Japonica Group]
MNRSAETETTLSSCSGMFTLHKAFTLHSLRGSKLCLRCKDPLTCSVLLKLAD